MEVCLREANTMVYLGFQEYIEEESREPLHVEFGGFSYGRYRSEKGCKTLRDHHHPDNIRHRAAAGDPCPLLSYDTKQDNGI